MSRVIPVESAVRRAEVDDSIKRTHGWILLAYAVLWAGVGLLLIPPIEVGPIVGLVPWSVVYALLIDASFDRLVSTGGLWPRPGVSA